MIQLEGSKISVQKQLQTSATYLCSDLAEFVEHGIAHREVSMDCMLDDLKSSGQLAGRQFLSRSAP